MPVTRALLAELGVSDANIARYLDPLKAATALHAIDTPLRIAHFLAQVVHESGRMRMVVEGMSYSAERLLKVFPRHFKDLAEAQAYARQPERIGNRVYGNRMGNGDEASGDGYRYRGRGLIQLTGKHNYQAFSRWLGDDLLAHPERVAECYAVQSAVFFWDTQGLNPLADRDDIIGITRRINGGLNGLDDRVQLLETAKLVLATTGEQSIVGVATDAMHSQAANSKGLKSEQEKSEDVESGGVDTGEAGAADERRSGIRPSQFDLSLEPTHRITATRLNLRSAPRVCRTTRIASLPKGELVQVMGEAEVPGWVQVRVVLQGQVCEGVLSSYYLKPV